jgi:excisionase family DNA binding protein
MVNELLLTPERVGEVLSLSRSRVYELLAAKRIASVKVGRARRVPASAVAAFVAELEAEASAAR